MNVRTGDKKYWKNIPGGNKNLEKIGEIRPFIRCKDEREITEISCSVNREQGNMTKDREVFPEVSVWPSKKLSKSWTEGHE